MDLAEWLSEISDPTLTIWLNFLIATRPWKSRLYYDLIRALGMESRLVVKYLDEAVIFAGSDCGTFSYAFVVSKLTDQSDRVKYYPELGEEDETLSHAQIRAMRQMHDQNAPIFEADDAEKLRLIMSYPDHDSFETYLFLAAKYNAIRCFRVLVSVGAKGNSAILRAAIVSGNTEMIEILLDGSLDQSACVPNAVHGWQFSLFDWFLDEKGCPVGDAIINAISTANLKSVIEIVSRFPAEMDRIHSNGWSAFHCACVSRSFCGEIIDFFVERGADVNALSNWSSPPIFDIAWWNSCDGLKYLIGLGADINGSNAYKQTAMHVAAKEQNVEIITILIAAGAQTDLPDEYGQTPYDIAKEIGATDVLDLLTGSCCQPRPAISDEIDLSDSLGDILSLSDSDLDGILSD